MKNRASATRIGLFVLGALAVLLGVVVMVSGSSLFAHRERALAYFEGSVYGLQVGAPVVLRGVRLGSVVGIGLVYAGQPGQYTVPVEIEIDRDRIGSATGQEAGVSVATLVQQGMTAQLGLQSLLTGLLYVDLDLGRTSRVPGRAAATTPAPTGALPVVPTVVAPLQTWQRQLQQLDLQGLLADVAATAAGARQLLANPRLQDAVDELAQAGGDLRRLLTRLDRRIDPLAGALQDTLQESRRAAATLSTALAGAGDAVSGVKSAAADVSAAMRRFDRLAADAQPALDAAQRAAEQLAHTAQALRLAGTDDDGALPRIEQAAHELARAARAVRELADLLQRQPEALLRGRSSPP